MKPISLEEIHQAQLKLSQLRWTYWIHHVVFSWQWLFMLAALVLLFVIWLKWVNKRQLVVISLYGVFSFIIITYLDTLGGDLELWEYPYMVLPWGPRILCIDLVITIIYMFIYQYFRSWKSFFYMMVATSFIFSFVLEPLSVWMNIYKPYVWKPIYSFPIYIIIALFVRWVVVAIYKVEHHNEK